MNFIQRLQTSHLNRHGFIDVLVGVVVLKAIYVALILFFCNLNDVPDDKGPSSLWLLVFVMLLIAPLFENLLMIAIAAVHEKLFKRTLLFVVTPLVMAAHHFRTPQHLPFPSAVRFTELFFIFYVFLKQYDLHKLEIGKGKALLLSGALHFASNATGFLILYFVDLYIDAETIFSAQPGE